LKKSKERETEKREKVIFNEKKAQLSWNIETKVHFVDNVLMIYETKKSYYDERFYINFAN